MTSTFDRLHDRIAACHNADLAQFVPWFAAGRIVGWVHHERVGLVTDTMAAHGAGLLLPGADYETRTAKLADWVERTAARGELRKPMREYYAVAEQVDAPPLLQVDRCAVAWLGVASQGVHLNGFVRDASGVRLWIATRSRHKPTFPGHLDNLVAGGQSIAHGSFATLVKECDEEASIPSSLAEGAAGAGSLFYRQQDGRSLKVDTLRCYDLELPADFVPRANDGEVESFELLTADAVIASLGSDAPWKPNSAIVVIDFLLRHGALVELSADQRAGLRRALVSGRA
ncbi:MAG: hypothetical protein RL398_3047 [Planctomycetota bacterium]